MEAYKVIEIKKSVFESNDREAEKLRAELKAEKTFLVNLMSSPGSGKTTMTCALLMALKRRGCAPCAFKSCLLYTSPSPRDTR